MGRCNFEPSNKTQLEFKSNNMNTLRNSVRLVGNLGMDPEVKVFDTNKKLARLSIATNDSYKNDKGEKVNDTQWHNLVFWGAQAKLAEDFLKKGDEVAIEGRISNRSYVDKDGVKRYTNEIIVNEFLKITGKISNH